jgi:octaprenyl-diphosphate synthase
MTSAVTPSPASATLSPGVLYQSIADELQQVERILRTQLRSRDPYVDELVRYGCLLGGKRLRPALLLLAGKALGRIGPEHLTLAAVIEMIHTATLVHDDVLDEATTRRHLATVNSRWDNEASILLGDFLFSHAYHLAASLGDLVACQTIGQSAKVVCEGELRQKGSRGCFDLSEEDYYGIIEAKTAELCACSCLLGARHAGAEPAVAERLEAYGRYLGIAFQIADDILDVAGQEQTTGKSLGTDLQQQKPTLPLIRLLHVADDSTRAAVLHLLTIEAEGRAQTLRDLFDEYQTLRYAEQQARHFAQLAQQQLYDLPGHEAVTSLRQLTDFVVQRSS